MALTATATQGFEYVGLTSGEEIFYLPGDPGDTFTRGQQVQIANGVLDDAGDSVDPVGVVMETTVCPAATQAAPPSDDYNKISKDAADLCLVPVKMLVPAGEPIFRVTFANHFDDTLAAYTSATPSITLSTSPGANDDSNGSIIYVYEGPGMGEILIGADYVHTSKVLTTHRVAKATLTTSSKVLILEGEGGSVGGISFLGRVDADTNAAVDMGDGYDDGNWMLWFDFLEAPSLLKNLTVKVIRAAAYHE